jgi:hypothetical protein
MTPEQEWSAYLDAVEASARTIARQAVDRCPPEPGDLLAPAQPGVPWPSSLEPRRREVMASLAAATATVQRCRDAAAQTLTALARPAVRAPHGYTDGATVDVVG